MLYKVLPLTPHQYDKNVSSNNRPAWYSAEHPDSPGPGEGKTQSIALGQDINFYSWIQRASVPLPWKGWKRMHLPDQWLQTLYLELDWVSGSPLPFTRIYLDFVGARLISIIIHFAVKVQFSNSIFLVSLGNRKIVIPGLLRDHGAH